MYPPQGYGYQNIYSNGNYGYGQNYQLYSWGLGIGDWGLGIGPNPQSSIPNPQSPIPSKLFNAYCIII